MTEALYIMHESSLIDWSKALYLADYQPKLNLSFVAHKGNDWYTLFNVANQTLNYLQLYLKKQEVLLGHSANMQ